MARVRTIEFKVAVPGCEYLAGEEILDLTTRARGRACCAAPAITRRRREGPGGIAGLGTALRQMTGSRTPAH